MKVSPTPAQAHIITRIMGCVEDLSTFEFSQNNALGIPQPAVWLRWKEQGIHMLGFIATNATAGWVSAEGQHCGMPAPLQKCYDSLLCIPGCIFDEEEPDEYHGMPKPRGALDAYKFIPDTVLRWTIEETT